LLAECGVKKFTYVEREAHFEFIDTVNCFGFVTEYLSVSLSLSLSLTAMVIEKDKYIFNNTVG
jgi:hypothetical protein